LRGRFSGLSRSSQDLTMLALRAVIREVLPIVTDGWWPLNLNRRDCDKIGEVFAFWLKIKGLRGFMPMALGRCRYRPVNRCYF
jgi:hypothetical protein